MVSISLVNQALIKHKIYLKSLKDLLGFSLKVCKTTLKTHLRIWCKHRQELARKEVKIIKGNLFNNRSFHYCRILRAILPNMLLVIWINSNLNWKKAPKVLCLQALFRLVQIFLPNMALLLWLIKWRKHLSLMLIVEDRLNEKEMLGLVLKRRIISIIPIIKELEWCLRTTLTLSTAVLEQKKVINKSRQKLKPKWIWQALYLNIYLVLQM